MCRTVAIVCIWSAYFNKSTNSSSLTNDFYFLDIDGQSVEYVFECHLKTGKVVNMPADKVNELKVLHADTIHTETKFKVNCPAVVFELFPDNGKAL